jgi:hypothetical protein
VKDTYLAILVLGGISLPALWGLWTVVRLIVGALLGGSDEHFEIDE